MGYVLLALAAFVIDLVLPSTLVGGALYAGVAGLTLRAQSKHLTLRLAVFCALLAGTTMVMDRGFSIPAPVLLQYGITVAVLGAIAAGSLIPHARSHASDAVDDVQMTAAAVSPNTAEISSFESVEADVPAEAAVKQQP